MGKKILIIGNKEEYTLDYIYFKTFKKLGYKVDFFSIDRSLKHRVIAKFNYLFPVFKFTKLRKKILSFFKKNKKKYDLIIIFKGIYLNKITLLKIKKIQNNSKFINIFPDDPFNVFNPSISNKNFLNLINYFDFFCIWSKKIKLKLNKKFKNLRTIYLPFGYDSIQKYNFNKSYRSNKDQILFVGTFEKDRLKVLKKIKLKKVIYGGNWKRILSKGMNNFEINTHVHGKKLQELISKSKISLNILRKQNLGSHNMRTFEIPGCNGLMLTTRTKEQNEFFRENKACYMFSNAVELNKKIKFILENPKKSEKVRKYGSMLVKQHSYLNRIKFLMNKVNELNRYKR